MASKDQNENGHSEENDESDNDENDNDCHDAVKDDEMQKRELGNDACNWGTQGKKRTLGSRKKKTKLDPVAQRIIAAIEKEDSSKEPESPKVVNCHMLFFENILPFVENFSDDDTLSFQASVLQLIRDTKLQRNNLHYLSATSFPSYSGVSTPTSTQFHPHGMNIPQPRARCMDSLQYYGRRSSTSLRYPKYASQASHGHQIHQLR